jgi:CP family cyanate transporter-like MFS transporter
MSVIQKSTLKVLVGVLLAAAILRPPVSMVGPLLTEIQAELGLSSTAISILGSIPVIGFGIGALFTPRLYKRFSSYSILLVAIATLTLAIWLRSNTGTTGLFVWTSVIGLAIAVGNTILPTIVREFFAERIALLTGIYTTVLAITAGLGSAIAVPLAGTELAEWRAALQWPLFIGLIAVAWLAISHFHTKKIELEVAPLTLVLKNKFAWQVTLFVGLQSINFYAVLTWLPALLQEAGYDPQTAGQYLSFSTTIGVPVGLALHYIQRSFSSLGAAAAWASGIGFVGMLGLALFPSNLTLLWLALSGLGQGVAFPLGLAMVAARAASASTTTTLSAMSQGFGYLMAAISTYLIGEAAGLTGTWQSVAWILAAFALIQTLLARGAGANHPIEIAEQ